MTAAPHVLAIACNDLRRTWRTLLLIGTLAAAVGTTTIGAVSVARRTATAVERLERATGADDARGLVLQRDDLVDDLTQLPQVAESWSGRSGIAQVDGGFVFLGVTAGPRRPSALLEPVILEGRLPRRADGDTIEIALRDDFQREVGIPLGTEMPVRFLTRADYFRFDTGFEDDHPSGPELTLRVVGTVRLPPGPASLPALAAPEALEQHPDAFGPGATWFVELDGGERSLPAFRQAVDALFDGVRLPPEASEYEVAAVLGTADTRVSVQRTAGLLATALLVLAGSVGLVGLVAVVQATARHRGAFEDEGLVHRALGATRRDLRLASAAALTIPAVLAGLVAAIGGTAAGMIGPIGAISNYESNVGWAPNTAVVGLGAALTSATMLIAAVAAATPRAAGAATLLRRERQVVAWLGRFGGRPTIASGLRFALDPGRGARAVPVRSAIVGAVIGVVAVVGGSVFVASLGRLIDTPGRTGLPHDVLISNSDADVRDEVLLEPGVGAVVEVAVAAVEIEGRGISAHALTPARGRLDIDLVAGRLPLTPDEITLGLRVASDLGVRPSDTVTARDRQGRARELAVVGVGVVPVFNGEELGMNALLTPAGQQAVALSEPIDSLAVVTASGAEPRELGERLGERFEAGPGATPTEVDNLDQLGSLPALVAVLLGLIGLVALAHAMILLVRRRQVDLALLQAIGLERRQMRAVVVTAAITVGAIGVVVGIPLGLAAGSTLWRLTATGAFVAPDPLLRWWVLIAAAGATGVVSTIAALLPAQRASRIAPVARLRRE